MRPRNWKIVRQSLTYRYWQFLDDAEDAPSRKQLECFPAGTLIAIPGATAGATAGEGRPRVKPIEQMIVGEDVLAYDLVQGRWEPRPVIAKFQQLYQGESVFVTVGEETIESTFRHPYWVITGENLAERPFLKHHFHPPEDAAIPGRWVDAGDLRAGDLLLLMDGRRLPVEAVRTELTEQLVYNFHVDGLQNYAVGTNHVLVHNNNGDELVPDRLTDQQINNLADELRDGQTNVKKLRKRGISDDDIAEIQQRALDNRPRQHDAHKIIEEIQGSQDALQQALRDLQADPTDPALQKAVEEATKQVDEITEAQRSSEILRRRRNIKNE